MTSSRGHVINRVRKQNNNVRADTDKHTRDSTWRNEPAGGPRASGAVSPAAEQTAPPAEVGVK
jgi:hypothetical protein